MGHGGAPPHVVPSVGRHVLVGRDCVVIEHLAELLDFVVQERLLFGRQLRGVGVHQVLEARAAAENVTVEADSASAERDLLGLRHLRHLLLGEVVRRAREERAAVHDRPDAGEPTLRCHHGDESQQPPGELINNKSERARSMAQMITLHLHSTERALVAERTAAYRQ